MQTAINLFKKQKLVQILEYRTSNLMNISSFLHCSPLMVYLKNEAHQTLDHRSLIGCTSAIRTRAKFIPKRAQICFLDVDQVYFCSLLQASVSVHDIISRVLKSSVSNVKADMRTSVLFDNCVFLKKEINMTSPSFQVYSVITVNIIEILVRKPAYSFISCKK